MSRNICHESECEPSPHVRHPIPRHVIEHKIPLEYPIEFNNILQSNNTLDVSLDSPSAKFATPIYSMSSYKTPLSGACSDRSVLDDRPYVDYELQEPSYTTAVTTPVTSGRVPYPVQHDISFGTSQANERPHREYLNAMGGFYIDVQDETADDFDNDFRIPFINRHTPLEFHVAQPMSEPPSGEEEYIPIAEQGLLLLGDGGNGERSLGDNIPEETIISPIGNCFVEALEDSEVSLLAEVSAENIHVEAVGNIIRLDETEEVATHDKVDIPSCRLESITRDDSRLYDEFVWSPVDRRLTLPRWNTLVPVRHAISPSRARHIKPKNLGFFKRFVRKVFVCGKKHF